MEIFRQGVGPRVGSHVLHLKLSIDWDALLRCWAPSDHIREFSQIDNVDVDVNIDVKSHPVGSTTPQKKEVQSSRYLIFSLPDIFAVIFL